MSPKLVYSGRLAACLLLSWGVLYGIYHSTLTRYQDLANQRLMDATLNRIALDMPELRLADERLKQASHSLEVSRYLDLLNQYLSANHFPFAVAAIQETEVELAFAASSTIEKQLLFPRQTMAVTFAFKPAAEQVGYWLPVLLAVLLSYLAIPHLSPPAANAGSAAASAPAVPLKLTLDLTSRTLYLNRTPDIKVSMANKPFCFYLAMLEYCATDNSAALYHHKSLPEEFLCLTEKYFTRLMDLGHTKRKRPDFSANIDKMLSEIRNALDEALAHEVEIKEKFFPKKAKGEGSRSKLNNFSLSNITTKDYEFVGK